ncbi:MAG TPA: hypothetical protein DCM40_00895 [Maribacter sp.]|uniref:hypothetical protein n=1 Tax=Maribacter sp. UBA4516 TaxID=1946804 RepID=UPI000EC46EF6|nr:hypothetical protein [Maribacter sp. UBA4516]HAI36784.1 hypothetical protein [Maribacter sp.]|tara:strand:- start:1872 stop:2699 length:828 start_codon:yes stop_codon:yes gene_type:complete
MNPEEYKWHINLVKDRLGYLNLTFEQAEKVYLHEEDKMTYSEKHFFSEWEEWDFDLSLFRKILNKEKFQDFEKAHQENIKRYEKSLVENDKPRDTDISYNKELIDFYTNGFLPDFFNKENQVGFLRTLKETDKIEYLKKEYKKFLNERKKELLTSHFRYNRSFKPNVLELELLRHKLIYIIPNYLYFKQEMDKPTKAISEYLENKFRYLIDTEEETISEKFQELKEFNQKCFEKYYGKPSSADTYFIKAPELTSAEERTYNTMTVLLLDEKKYGC